MIADGAADTALHTPVAPQSRPIRTRLVLTVAGFGALTLVTCALAPLVGSSSISLRRALDTSIPFAANVDALATRYPALADALRSLQPAQIYFIQALPDHVRLGVGSRVSLLPSRNVS